jgi:hypothetical protein
MADTSRNYPKTLAISGSEEITNFNNKVEEEKALFCQQVINFVNRSSYGIACCHEDEDLRNFQRKLDILTNYDTRDIYHCTDESYILDEDNVRYLRTTGIYTYTWNAVLTPSAYPETAYNLIGLSLSSTPYQEDFVEFYNSWISANIQFGGVIRIIEENSLSGSIRMSVYLIQEIEEYPTFANYSLISLNNLNNTYGGNFTFTSDIVRISKPGSTKSFQRNTSGTLSIISEFCSLTNLTTTSFNVPTYFQFLTTNPWVSQFILNDYLVLFSEAPVAYATYRITNITIIGNYTNLYVTLINSSGTFSTSTSKLWYLSRVDANISSTTIPPVCTQDTTNYNNISYTEIKKLLNS